MNTVTLDDTAYAALPDRQELTGTPIENQFYRDSTDPTVIWKWVVGRPGHAAWMVFSRASAGK